MRTKIETTINWGDAGYPIDITIDVDYDQYGKQVMIHDYEEEGGVIFVHASEESGDTPDHPTKSWEETIKERIEDHFYPLIVKFL